jgi:tryptophanyl-tRNA synthetase
MRKKIMRIATDSRPLEEPKDPAGDHLFQLYTLFATAEEQAEMAALYQRGGFGYGQVKTALADVADRTFEPFRQRRAELAARPQEVREILAAGASGARRRAADVLSRAQAACGLRSA